MAPVEVWHFRRLKPALFFNHPKPNLLDVLCTELPDSSHREFLPATTFCVTIELPYKAVSH